MTQERYKILIVDDLSDWRTTLKGLLSDVGYQAETASSSIEAEALIKNNRFDLALLDIRLDEQDEENSDGLNLATTIQQQWPDTKIIILTGHGTNSYIEQAYKPNGINQLSTRKYLEKKETEKLIPTINYLLTQ